MYNRHKLKKKLDELEFEKSALRDDSINLICEITSASFESSSVMFDAYAKVNPNFYYKKIVLSDYNKAKVLPYHTYKTSKRDPLVVTGPRSTITNRIYVGVYCKDDSTKSYIYKRSRLRDFTKPITIYDRYYIKRNKILFNIIYLFLLILEEKKLGRIEQIVNLSAIINCIIEFENHEYCVLFEILRLRNVNTKGFTENDIFNVFKLTNKNGCINLDSIFSCPYHRDGLCEITELRISQALDTLKEKSILGKKNNIYTISSL